MRNDNNPINRPTYTVLYKATSSYEGYLTDPPAGGLSKETYTYEGPRKNVTFSYNSETNKYLARVAEYEVVSSYDIGKDKYQEALARGSARIIYGQTKEVLRPDGSVSRQIDPSSWLESSYTAEHLRKLISARGRVEGGKAFEKYLGDLKYKQLGLDKVQDRVLFELSELERVLEATKAKGGENAKILELVNIKENVYEQVKIYLDRLSPHVNWSSNSELITEIHDKLTNISSYNGWLREKSKERLESNLVKHEEDYEKARQGLSINDLKSSDKAEFLKRVFTERTRLEQRRANLKKELEKAGKEAKTVEEFIELETRIKNLYKAQTLVSKAINTQDEIRDFDVKFQKQLNTELSLFKASFDTLEIPEEDKAKLELLSVEIQEVEKRRHDPTGEVDTNKGKVQDEYAERDTSSVKPEEAKRPSPKIEDAFEPKQLEAKPEAGSVADEVKQQLQEAQVKKELPTDSTLSKVRTGGSLTELIGQAVSLKVQGKAVPGIIVGVSGSNVQIDFPEVGKSIAISAFDLANQDLFSRKNKNNQEVKARLRSLSKEGLNIGEHVNFTTSLIYTAEDINRLDPNKLLGRPTPAISPADSSRVLNKINEGSSSSPFLGERAGTPKVNEVPRVSTDRSSWVTVGAVGSGPKGFFSSVESAAYGQKLGIGILSKYLAHASERLGGINIVTGVNSGFELMVAGAAIKARKAGYNVGLTIVMPHDTYRDKPGATFYDGKSIYTEERLKKAAIHGADRVVYLNEGPDLQRLSQSPNYLINERTAYIVDQSDRVLVGGTGSNDISRTAIGYANSRTKPVLDIGEDLSSLTKEAVKAVDDYKELGATKGDIDKLVQSMVDNFNVTELQPNQAERKQALEPVSYPSTPYKTVEQTQAVPEEVVASRTAINPNQRTSLETLGRSETVVTQDGTERTVIVPKQETESRTKIPTRERSSDYVESSSRTANLNEEQKENLEVARSQTGNTGAMSQEDLERIQPMESELDRIYNRGGRLGINRPPSSEIDQVGDGVKGRSEIVPEGTTGTTAAPESSLPLGQLKIEFPPEKPKRIDLNLETELADLEEFKKTVLNRPSTSPNITESLLRARAMQARKDAEDRFEGRVRARSTSGTELSATEIVQKQLDQDKAIKGKLLPAGVNIPINEKGEIGADISTAEVIHPSTLQNLAARAAEQGIEVYNKGELVVPGEIKPSRSTAGNPISESDLPKPRTTEASVEATVENVNTTPKKRRGTLNITYEDSDRSVDPATKIQKAEEKQRVNPEKSKVFVEDGRKVAEKNLVDINELSSEDLRALPHEVRTVIREDKKAELLEKKVIRSEEAYTSQIDRINELKQREQRLRNFAYKAYREEQRAKANLEKAETAYIEERLDFKPKEMYPKEAEAAKRRLMLLEDRAVKAREQLAQAKKEKEQTNNRRYETLTRIKEEEAKLEKMGEGYTRTRARRKKFTEERENRIAFQEEALQRAIQADLEDAAQKERKKSSSAEARAGKLGLGIMGFGMALQALMLSDPAAAQEEKYGGAFGAAVTGLAGSSLIGASALSRSREVSEDEVANFAEHSAILGSSIVAGHAAETVASKIATSGLNIGRTRISGFGLSTRMGRIIGSAANIASWIAVAVAAKLGLFEKFKEAAQELNKAAKEYTGNYYESSDSDDLDPSGAEGGEAIFQDEDGNILEFDDEYEGTDFSLVYGEDEDEEPLITETTE